MLFCEGEKGIYVFGKSAAKAEIKKLEIIHILY